MTYKEIAEWLAITLTTGADTPASSNTIYNAQVSGTDTDTLTGIDTINATGANDVLNVIVTAGTAVLNGADVSGVETINVRNTGAGAAAIDASTSAGVTKVVADRGTGTLAVTNLATGAALGVNGNGTVVQGAVTGTYATATDAVKLDISGGTKMTAGITVTGTATSATVNSTGAANTVGTVDLANASLTSVTINATTGLKGDLLSQATDQVATGGKVTITGAGAVELTAALDNSIAVIDASASTGGLTATLGTLGTISVTGGSGADVITTTNALSGDGKIDGGAGSDTLVVTNTLIDTAAEAARFVNFETIRTAGTLNMATSLSGVTALQLTDSSTLTNLTATQAANITIRANAVAGTGDAQSFSLATSTGTADVLSIVTGTGTTTGEATDIAALTANGFETLNIKTNAGPTVTQSAANKTTTVASITADKLTKINLSGTAVNIANAATTLATTIDASALTGDGETTSTGLTVAGSLIAGSSVIGSGVADAMTIGAEGSSYNGGNGNDNFTTTSAILAADGVTDTTINGGAGTDTLTISAASSLTDNNFTYVSGMENLKLVGGAVAESITGLGAAARAAFANGITVTEAADQTGSGNAFVWSSGLYDKNVTLTHTTTSDGKTANVAQSVTTGAGNDKITLVAASLVGDDTAGTVVINTGAGSDTIALTTGTLANNLNASVSVTGGSGVDDITVTHTNGTGATSNISFIFAAGDSAATVGGNDKITGFLKANGTNMSDLLDFAGTGAVATVATSTDFGLIKSHSVTTGVVQFDDAATYAAALVINSSNLADVIGYLAANTADLDIAAFAYDDNGDGTADATMVYSNGVASDSLVLLAGVTGVTSLVTANATTNHAVFIA